MDEDITPENSTIGTEMVDEDEMHSTRKRKRDDMNMMSQHEQLHILYADDLLDYFMLSMSPETHGPQYPPQPPPNFVVDRHIDDQGHPAFHWACSMGDISVMRDLLERGANMQSRNCRGETPLMRAVLFTNNYEKESMPQVLEMLRGTIGLKDDFGSTVIHHAA